MEPGKLAGAPPVSKAFWLAAGFLVLGAALGAYYYFWPAPPDVLPQTKRADPRATYDTPFRNVRPNVAYAGSATCAECHEKEAKSYARHPMGRSLFPVAQVADQERYDKASNNPYFKDGGLVFQIERRGQQVLHKVHRKGADGQLLYALEAEVQYVLGSGARGRSYLVNYDGYLFQSPISWFAQRQGWDHAPGYPLEGHFDRPISTACLFCHANDAAAVAHTENHYRQPIFREHALGCERCHGPGQLHVEARRGEETKPDYTIVNPRHLEPALRDAVCEQCHLQGEAKVLRRGWDAFDYRPGMPFTMFFSVFLRHPDMPSEHKAVSQVEQMRASRCYQASNGKLGCISCHDPHYYPDEAARVSFYRGRCLECHKDQPCSQSLTERRKKQPNDDCAACHMPRLRSTDIAHTALSDHRVLRHGTPPTPPSPRDGLRPDEVPLVYFHSDQTGPDDPEVSRDLAVALTELGQRHRRGAPMLASLALPRLTKALREQPDDLVALESKAQALWALGRLHEALTTLEEVLTYAPRREGALRDAGILSRTMGQIDAAVGYGQRLIEVNPWVARYRWQFAEALTQRLDWARAAAECQEALRLNPGAHEARWLLVRCYLRQGDKERARAEFQTLLALTPRSEEIELRRQYAEELRR